MPTFYAAFEELYPNEILTHPAMTISVAAEPLTILAHVAGRYAGIHINTLPADRVDDEVSPYVIAGRGTPVVVAAGNN